jgi:hypothetical protein
LFIITIAIKIAERKIVIKSRGKTIIYGLKTWIYFILFGFFINAFFNRFYKWSDCYNESGRCYDPISQQVYTEAGMFWIVPAFIFFFLGIKRFSNAGSTDKRAVPSALDQ